MGPGAPEPSDPLTTYERFVQAYQRGDPRWDTGITPPELVEVVEGAQAMPPGRALDLGCGTGTNSLYLAHHGWDVTGVDFVPAAIERAQEKLSLAGSVSGSIQFLHGDVTHLDALNLRPGYTLLLDLGCLHSIPPTARPGYAQGVVHLAAHQALFLLYGFTPNQQNNNSLTPQEIQTLFGPAFTLERYIESPDRPGLLAAWYWLRCV